MTEQYDFVSQTISLANVKSIIGQAGYDPADFRYSARVDNDGYLVDGDTVMSVTRLEQAAKALHIKVEIFSAVTATMSLAALGGGQPYNVTINMTPDTVQALTGGNYYLYGFKAVQSTQGGGAPLVWFQTQDYSATTAVDWEVQYQAYTSRSEIITNGQVTASFAADANLGQTLNVEAGGVGQVVNGGPSTAISLNNQTTDQFTCGISEVVGGVAKPLCAFPLYGKQMDVIAPIEKVLLMFSTLPVNTGTVIEQAYSSGILVDLTSANQRSVTFDINQGWSWGGFNWAQSVAPNSNLVPLLIEPASSAASKFEARSLVSC